MVVVQVGDQDGVERAGRRRRRDLAAQMGHPGAQDRVGQHTGAGQLEQDRRMAEPRDPVPGHGPPPCIRPHPAGIASGADDTRGLGPRVLIAHIRSWVGRLDDVHSFGAVRAARITPSG